MSRKSKGINAERDLIHKFWAVNIPSIRVAGSGSIKYPVPDVLVGTPKNKLAIECKSTKSLYQYFTFEEVKQLIEFSHLFGATPYLGVKFNNKQWIFLKPENTPKSNLHFIIKSDKTYKKALIFDDLVKTLKIH